MYDGKVPRLHHFAYRMKLGRVEYYHLIGLHDTLGIFYSGLHILELAVILVAGG